MVIATSGLNHEIGEKVVHTKEPELTPKDILLADVDSIYITIPVCLMKERKLIKEAGKIAESPLT